MHEGQHRIRYLDGLRGLAILLVLLWHYLGPVYAMHLPYRDRYAELPIVHQGWAGVNLFFLISGYVIFVTLERCSGTIDFMLRRWLRLFPAMLVGSAIIFLCAQPLAALMPGGRAHPIDLLPGLTLVDPFFYRLALDLRMRSLDGAFWTLYVEAAFYLVIGILYFRLGWARAVAALLVLSTGLVVAPALVPRAWVHEVRPWYQACKYAGFGYFGWFASGALFLKARVERDRGLFAMGLAIGLIAALTSAMPDWIGQGGRLTLAASVLLFAAVQRWGWLQRLLERPALLFFGFVSYPLYLLHSVIGVGLIALLGRLPALLAVPAVILAMLAAAWMVARFLEPALTRLLKPWTDRLRRLAGSRPAGFAGAGGELPA